MSKPSLLILYKADYVPINGKAYKEAIFTYFPILLSKMAM